MAISLGDILSGLQSGALAVNSLTRQVRAIFPASLDGTTFYDCYAGDEWRYACMSRPWDPPTKELPKPENVSGYRPLYSTDAQPGDWRTY